MSLEDWFSEANIEEKITNDYSEVVSRRFPSYPDNFEKKGDIYQQERENGGVVVKDDIIITYTFKTKNGIITAELKAIPDRYNRSKMIYRISPKYNKHDQARDRAIIYFEAMERSEQRFRMKHLPHDLHCITGGSVYERTEQSFLMCKDCGVMYCFPCAEIDDTNNQLDHQGCGARVKIAAFPDYYKTMYKEMYNEHFVKKVEQEIEEIKEIDY